ncbi:MAG: hypothetical protein J6Q42_01995 [Clostridia bacterium]|nr:hypothetical protein [Clostridia bacterium]
MCSDKNNCSCTAVIVGILAGVILGVLYGLGFVPVGVVFWAYLLLGAAAVLLAPIYASVSPCFCSLRSLFFTAALGTVVAAAVALLTVGIVGLILSAILTGIATFFAVFLLITVVCISACSGHNY